MPDSANQVLARYFNLDAADQAAIEAKVGAGLSLGDLLVGTDFPVGASASPSFLRPTAAKAETVHRDNGMTNLAGVLTSGTLRLVAVPLPIGLVVASITFLSGTQAAVAPTNQWFTIHDSARVMKGVSADDTNVAWAANAPKTLALAVPYLTTYTGLYYFGIMVAAGTTPTLIGVSSTSVVTGLAPITSGQADTGLTTPPVSPFTATALGASSVVPYAWAA